MRRPASVSALVLALAVLASPWAAVASPADDALSGSVSFDTNSAALPDSAHPFLDRAAGFLKQNPAISVRVEGHCDERGNHEYNLALGAKRAQAVTAYLVAGGVSPAQLQPISLGKERPTALGTDDASRAADRVVMLVRSDAH